MAAKRTFTDQYVNVGAQQVATIYARALVDAAEAAGQTEPVMSELDSFITDVLDGAPKLEAVLGSALVSAEEKNALLGQGLPRQGLTAVSELSQGRRPPRPARSLATNPSSGTRCFTTACGASCECKWLRPTDLGEDLKLAIDRLRSPHVRRGARLGDRGPAGTDRRHRDARRRHRLRRLDRHAIGTEFANR